MVAAFRCNAIVYYIALFAHMTTFNFSFYLNHICFCLRRNIFCTLEKKTIQLYKVLFSLVVETQTNMQTEQYIV